MPYETIQEKVVRERRIRVCARCRNPIPDNADRPTYNTVGGIGGSLGASLGGSILLGSVLGPVGAIGGAIAGSIAGARAGKEASDKVCDAIESLQESLCQACRNLTNNNNNNTQGSEGNALAGGHRLGSGQPIQRTSTTPGDKIGEAASAAGRGINNGLSWMKQSVTNVIENVKKPGDNINNTNNNNNNNNNCGDKKPPPSTGGGNGGTETSGIL